MILQTCFLQVATHHWRASQGLPPFRSFLTNPAGRPDPSVIEQVVYISFRCSSCAVCLQPTTMKNEWECADTHLHHASLALVWDCGQTLQTQRTCTYRVHSSWAHLSQRADVHLPLSDGACRVTGFLGPFKLLVGRVITDPLRSMQLQSAVLLRPASS